LALLLFDSGLRWFRQWRSCKHGGFHKRLKASRKQAVSLLRFLLLSTCKLRRVLHRKQTIGGTLAISPLGPKSVNRLHCLTSAVASEPSATLYEQHGPRDPANNYDCQCFYGIDVPILPWTRLQYKLEPQQRRGCYQNARLKIVIDSFAFWITIFNRPPCPIKSESRNKCRYCDRRCDACQRDNFAERDPWANECESDCDKRNCCGLPAKSYSDPHLRFLRLKS
jgi:hypothetical protein